MTRYAHAERGALCDTLLEVGPDVPTLCGSWTSAELLAHLIVREGRPDLAAGIFAAPLARRTESAMTRLLAEHDFGDLVERLRQGPPKLHPARVPLVDEQMNLVEMFIHHEDVLRAQLGAPRRTISSEMTSALGDRLNIMARMLFRSAKGVDLALVTAKRRTKVGSGNGPVVEIHGRPGEILLFGFGRQAVAEVELIGPPDAVETVRTGSYEV